MTNTLTITDICNMALDWIAGNNIQNIDDTNNPNAVLCKRHYSQCVRAEIDKYEWTFARKFSTLAAVDLTEYPDAAIDGYTAYHLPPDFSRISQYFFSEFYPYRKNQYDMGHNYFLTSDYLYVRYPIGKFPYISTTTPISKYHSLFCDVVAVALAQRIAKKIMGDDADIVFLESLYKKNVGAARRQNVLQLEPSATGMSDTQAARLYSFA